MFVSLSSPKISFMIWSTSVCRSPPLLPSSLPSESLRLLSGFVADAEGPLELVGKLRQPWQVQPGPQRLPLFWHLHHPLRHPDLHPHSILYESHPCSDIPEVLITVPIHYKSDRIWLLPSIPIQGQIHHVLRAYQGEPVMSPPYHGPVHLDRSWLTHINCVCF